MDGATRGKHARRRTVRGDTLIEYEFLRLYEPSGDSLFARIEGTRDGRERGVDLRYARVRCP